MLFGLYYYARILFPAMPAPIITRLKPGRIIELLIIGISKYSYKLLNYTLTAVAKWIYTSLPFLSFVFQTHRRVFWGRKLHLNVRMPRQHLFMYSFPSHANSFHQWPPYDLSFVVVVALRAMALKISKRSRDSKCYVSEPLIMSCLDCAHNACQRFRNVRVLRTVRFIALVRNKLYERAVCISGIGTRYTMRVVVDTDVLRSCNSTLFCH